MSIRLYRHSCICISVAGTQGVHGPGTQGTHARPRHTRAPTPPSTWAYTHPKDTGACIHPRNARSIMHRPLFRETIPAACVVTGCLQLLGPGRFVAHFIVLAPDPKKEDSALDYKPDEIRQCLVVTVASNEHSLAIQQNNINDCVLTLMELRTVIVGVNKPQL